MRRTKGSQSEIGMLYQYGVTTLLAAELSENNRVADYVIYSSENSAGKFDDVVARIKLKDQDDWYLSLIQVKYKEKKKLNVSDNLKGKRIERFLSDYIRCFNEILADPKLTCRRGIPTDNIRFAIFSNEEIQMPVFLRQDCTFQLKVCSYCEDKDNIVLPFGNRYWKFVCEDLENSEHQLFFDRCCLFLKQPNYNKCNKQIEKVCAISNAKEIINYVKDFFNDDYLYEQGLSKEVFEIELERIRLFDAIPPLITLEDVADDARIAIWNRITLEHDITAVNYVQDFITESTLYSCLVHKLNTLLDINVDWKTHVSKWKNIDSEIIKKFIAHSETKKFRYWIDPPHTLQLLIVELWKCGDLPLILRTRVDLKDSERYARPNRSYVVIDDWTDRSQEVADSKLNVFRCVSSIVNLELQETMLSSTSISLQGRNPITLKDLLTNDKELMSTFTCADLLRMMRKKTPFLNEDYFKGSNYLLFMIEDERCREILEHIEPYALGHNITVSYPPNRTEECLKIIQTHAEIFENYTIYRLRRIGEKLTLIEGDPNKLRHSFIDQYGDPLFISDANELFPIIGQTNKLNELEYIQRKLKRATLPRSFFSYPDIKICFLSGDLNSMEQDLEMTNVDDITNETIPIKKQTYFVKIEEVEKHQYYWRQLSQLGYPIFDVYIKDGRFDLLRFQNCKDLGLHISYDNSGKYTEDEFFNEIKSEAEEIAVITGDVGIGKTSLLKWLCNNYSTEDYIIFYDLINLQIDLSKCEHQKIDPINFIFKKIRRNIPKKYVTIVSSLLMRKRLIWVLDSFDEIRLACEKQVLDFIRLIAKSGARVIIATRTENCHVLMDQFGVRLIKIEPLEEKECSSYWHLNEDLLENVSSELATNPLYLNFLKIISINREQLLNITKFTLYQKVVNMKIRRCLLQTYRILYDSEIERTVSQFERLALVTMFGKEAIQRELYWIVDKEVTDMSKFGIITGFDEKAYPIFYHRSFVEFLVAQWIAKAHQTSIYKNTARCFYKQIFNENKLHILNILTEDVELHRTVLQTDLFKIDDMTREDPKCWDTVDRLGRTALHAAVINCRWVTRLSAAYKMLEFVVASMLKSGYDMRTSDTIMDWNWSEYMQREIFEFACVFQKLEIIKVYLHLHREKVDKHNYPTAVFPTKYFNMLFRTAIQFISIDMIADLVLLQNLENKIFRSFYRACLGLRVAECTPLWTEDIRFEGQLTLMHIACIYGSTSMIRNLIKLGLDVNAVDAFTYTPLYYCILRCSLRRSENVDDVENNRNIETIESILEAGAILDPLILSTNKISPLSLAVQTGNVQVVRILLATGADICRRCTDEDTPLHLAARVGDADIVQCLLDYKAPLFLENKRGETAIDIAIKQNRKQVIDILRARRDTADDTRNMEMQEVYVETNIDIGFGGTALHDAVSSGDLNRIEVLLSEGGDVNIRNRNGFTLLHAALNQNNAQIIDFLLSRVAIVDAQDKYGCTPLFIAIGNDNLPITAMILEKGADPNIANMFTVTPLYTAVANRNVDAIGLLLEKGANINVQRVDGITPLYQAARNGDVDVAVVLLENGADTEISDEYDATPLHIAVLERHREISELLLRNGANPNIHSKEGNAPLYLATFKEDIDTVRLLLENGAKVNDENADGVTALHVAAQFGNEDIARVLLENGANVNAKTIKGESVLFLATLSDEETDIVTLLLEANVDVDRDGGANALGLVIVKGDINALKLLLSRGVLGGVNAWDAHGHTPLHLAAEKGHAPIVDYLFEQGARINAKSLMGYTPLHHAVREKQEHIVKLLIDRGADINTESKKCRTAFMLAVDVRNVNIVKTLLEENNVNIDYDAGIETLKFAVCMGDVSIIKLLICKDVKVHIDSEYIYNLLYVTTINGDADIVQMLLEIVTIEDEVVYKSIRNLKNDDIEFTRLLLNQGANVDVLIGNKTSLHLKVAQGNVDFVKLLIENSADVNLRTEEGTNPLEIAVNCEYTNIVDVLLEGGADVNALTSSDDNVVRLAARKKNAILVESLLNKGTSMIVDEANGTTLLHECARESNMDILKVLLERKVDLNIQDNIGNTALHIAIIEQNLEAVALLSSRNADAYITNYNGRSPIHLATCKQCTNTIRSIVEDVRGDGTSREIETNNGDNIDVIWALLEHMKEINVDNDDVMETFYWAAEQGYSKIVQLLLYNGMNINVQDQYGYTALHLAVNNNHRDIVGVLLEQGVDVHLRSKQGVTPLDTARSRGYENIVEMIIIINSDAEAN